MSYSDFTYSIIPNRGLREFVLSRIYAYYIKPKKCSNGSPEIFILYGSGANGKTLFQKFVKEVLKENCEIVVTPELNLSPEALFRYRMEFKDLVKRRDGIPIFIVINSMRELDFLEYWENTHIIPTTNTFTLDPTRVNLTAHVYPMDVTLSDKLAGFAKEFVDTYKA